MTEMAIVEAVRAAGTAQNAQTAMQAAQTADPAAVERFQAAGKLLYVVLYFGYWLRSARGEVSVRLPEVCLQFLYWTLVIGLIITVFSIGMNYHRYLRNQLETLLDKTTEEQAGVSVTIRDTRVRGNDLSLPINDLLCIEAQKNNVAVSYLKDGKLQRDEIQSTLAAVLEDLGAYDNVFQCHRSFVVNLNNISSAKGNSNGYTLELGGGLVTVPVSRSFVPKLKSFIA